MRMPPGPVTVELDEMCHKAAPVTLNLQEADTKQVRLTAEPKTAVLDVEVSERSGGLAPGHFLLDGKNWGSNPNRGQVSTCAETVTLVQYGEEVWSKRLSGELSDGRPAVLRPEVAQNTLWKKTGRGLGEGYASLKDAYKANSDGFVFGLNIPAILPFLGPGWGVDVAQSLRGGIVRTGVRGTLTLGVNPQGARDYEGDNVVLSTFGGGVGEWFLNVGAPDGSFRVEFNAGYAKKECFNLTFCGSGQEGGRTLGFGLGWTADGTPDAMLRVRSASLSGWSHYDIWNGKKWTYNHIHRFDDSPSWLFEVVFNPRTRAFGAVK
jgi:hypothetical protein